MCFPSSKEKKKLCFFHFELDISLKIQFNYYLLLSSNCKRTRKQLTWVKKNKSHIEKNNLHWINRRIVERSLYLFWVLDVVSIDPCLRTVKVSPTLSWYRPLCFCLLILSVLPLPAIVCRLYQSMKKCIFSMCRKRTDL